MSEVLPLVILVGPTAAGKTQVALQLAEHLGQAEIVSADSRQIYRYLDIGTAKPSPAERRRVPHNLVDIRNPDERYNAGAFARDARAAIERVRTLERVPIIVGGSGMYVEALLDGLTPLPGENTETRLRIRQRLGDCGAAELYAQLNRADPQRARRIHPGDVRRLTRALEQLELMASQPPVDPSRNQPYWARPVCWFCISRPRDVLYERIDHRAEAMLGAGLLEETQHVLSMGYAETCPGLQTLGYAEALEALRGEVSRDLALERIKRRTRHYAKRQLTWFRRDRRLRWIDVQAVGTAGAIRRIMCQYERKFRR